MAWSPSRLDVGLWSLSVGTAMAAGCGPLIPIDGETDTDGPDDGGRDTDDVPWDTEEPETYTTTFPHDTDSPAECEGGCPAGYSCFEGTCVPYDDCYGYGSGGDDCCWDGCCYDYGGCYYDDCYYAEDCGGGSFCGGYDYGNSCHAAEELNNCDPGEALGRLIALPEEAQGAVALAFADVDASGGEELLVVQWNEARVVLGGGAMATAPVALPNAGERVWAAGMPEAGGAAFVVSAPNGGGVQRLGFEGGVFVAGPGAQVELERIGGGDFDGDGFGDVAGMVGQSLTWLRGGEVEFLAGVELDGYAFGPAATGEFDGDGLTDVAFHQEAGASHYITQVSDPGETIPLDLYAVRRTLVVADLDDDGSDDLTGLTSSGGTMLIVPWRYRWTIPGFARHDPLWISDFDTDDEGYYRAASGDVDGDGGEDVLIGGATQLRVLFGDPQGYDGFRCWIDIPIEHAATAIAVGDLDGDGRADVAFSDGNATTVLAHE